MMTKEESNISIIQIDFMSKLERLMNESKENYGLDIKLKVNKALDSRESFKDYSIDFDSFKDSSDYQLVDISYRDSHLYNIFETNRPENCIRIYSLFEGDWETVSIDLSENIIKMRHKIDTIQDPYGNFITRVRDLYQEDRCPFCERREELSVPTNNYDASICINHNNSVIFKKTDAKEVIVPGILSYCPICGKKLEVNN